MCNNVKILFSCCRPLQFGSEFFAGSSNSSSGTTTTTFTNKASFNTGNFENGQYQIFFNAYVTGNANSTSIGYRVYQNGLTSANIFAGSNTISSTTDNIAISQNAIVLLTGGSYNYNIDYNRPNGTGSAIISNIQLTIYRVNDTNTI